LPSIITTGSAGACLTNAAAAHVQGHWVPTCLRPPIWAEGRCSLFWPMCSCCRLSTSGVPNRTKPRMLEAPFVSEVGGWSPTDAMPLACLPRAHAGAPVALWADECTALLCPTSLHPPLSCPLLAQGSSVWPFPASVKKSIPGSQQRIGTWPLKSKSICPPSGREESGLM